MTLANACGCGDDLRAHTPVRIENRPGLHAVAYRVGTHAEFFQSMLARFATGPALQGLQTREPDDFSIALLDAWAMVADVLTFYQERLANESYLRTATERLSLLELGRLIGYELRPGVAASTYLAFTVEDAVGAPGYATVPVGTSVQSLPGPGETPQTFETVEALEAQGAWNSFRPRLTQPQDLSGSPAQLVVQGTTANLKPGDWLLVVTEAAQTCYTIQQVHVDPAAHQTVVALSLPGQAVARGSVTPAPGVYAFRTRAALFTYNAPDWQALSDTVRAHYTRTPSQTDWPVFTAPYPSLYLDAVYKPIVPASWIVVVTALGPSQTQVFSAEVTAVQELGVSSHTLSAQVTSLAYRAGPNVSLAPGSMGALRNVTVYAQSERLALAEVPIQDAVTGAEIVLDRVVRDLPPGRTLLVTGKRLRVQVLYTSTAVVLTSRDGVQSAPLQPGDILAVLAPPIVTAPGWAQWSLQDRHGFAGTLLVGHENVGLRRLPAAPTDAPVSEAVTVKSLATVSTASTTLTLTRALQHYYDRATVTIYANVALATHGASRQEVLGSGDASQAYQRFPLRQTPLTHVSAPTATGTLSTLQVRVNDLQWQEVPSLYTAGPHDRVFVTHTDDAGHTTVQFGDGRNGARLPTGFDNVTATYRQGIGLGGLVKAGQLNLLMTRPLGIKSVTNPLAAAGAADRETLADARQNAPLTVLTLERIVSLQDYEDFARAFAGIAKALATWTWDGQVRSVFLTVAGPRGADISPDSDLYTHLLTAIRQASDPYVPLRLQSYRHAVFQLAARLKVQAEYRPDSVLSAVRQALASQFAFEARALGQMVSLSDVLTVMQTIPGVVAVHVATLARADGIGGDGRQRPLPAAVPQTGAQDALLAAELLRLDMDSLNLQVMP